MATRHCADHSCADYICADHNRGDDNRADHNRGLHFFIREPCRFSCPHGRLARCRGPGTSKSRFEMARVERGGPASAENNENDPGLGFSGPWPCISTSACLWMGWQDHFAANNHLDAHVTHRPIPPNPHGWWSTKTGETNARSTSTQGRVAACSIRARGKLPSESSAVSLLVRRWRGPAVNVDFRPAHRLYYR